MGLGTQTSVNLARFQSQKQHNNLKSHLDWKLQGNAVPNQWRQQIQGDLKKSNHMHGKENGNGRQNVDWEEGNRRNQVLNQRQGVGMGYQMDWDKSNKRNQELKQQQGVSTGIRSIRGNKKPKEVWIWRRKKYDVATE